MNAYEGIYDQPKFGEALTRIVFDPHFLPIRSCLRPEDELQSCYGPVQKKSVGFSDYFVVVQYVVQEEDYVDMSGYKHLPKPRRKELYRLPAYDFAARGLEKWRQNYPPNFNASNILGYENLSDNPYAAWGMDSRADLYSNLNVAPNARRPILKKMNDTTKPKKSVHFAFMQENLTAVGEITKTFVTFDPLPDCWKSNFIFDTGAYWLNCNLCR